MAGMVGSSNSGVYRAAISQSPVSDWLYYGKDGPIVELTNTCSCLFACCCCSCYVTQILNFPLDSAYTERYMLKPNDNLQSYEVNMF